MAYIQPMVMVFQEYANMSASTQTATLTPCIVGPCRHVLNPDTDEILSLAGAYTSEGISGCMFPNNKPGALIDETSVHFRLKNALVNRTAEPLLTRSTNKNAVVFDTPLYPRNIAVGDYAVFFDLTDPTSPREVLTEYRVIGSNPETASVLINKSAPVGTYSVHFRVKMPEVLLDADETGISLDVTSERFDLHGLMVTVDGVACRIHAAEVYVGYSALRQDLFSVGTIYNMDELRGVLGKPIPENPLAFGVSIALANSSVGIKYIGIISDDLAGYTGAKDQLENHDPVYGIVPLTLDASVLAMFKMHAEQLSLPEQGMWRIALGCSPLVTEKQVAGSLGKVSVDGDGDLVVLTDETATFLSSGIGAGDELIVMSCDVPHTYTVASVAAEDILTITQSHPFDTTAFVPGTAYAYTVTHALDKTDQAKEIGNTSRAYGSSRFVHIWPDVCVIGERELPGFYLACAVSGGIGGLPPHYGFTRLSIAGIDGLRHANDYFNNEQLNAIADGGTFIFLQASSSAPPHIRHQLTTDRSTVEFQELSFVKNFDYVSYILRDVMSVFLGKWNITPSTLATLRTTLDAAMTTLKLNSLPKIGSPVLGYTIVSVEQLPNVRDRVEMYCQVEFPYPLNTIGLHVVSI